MNHSQLIEEVEKDQLKKDVPRFQVGDTVTVHTRIVEGEKERIQMFTGTVIARRGRGLSETFSLYRVSYGSGMERVFMIHSPRVAKIELVRSGKVRKGKLYYLRGVSGKAAKVKEYLSANKRASSAVTETSSSEDTTT